MIKKVVATTELSAVLHALSSVPNVPPKLVRRLHQVHEGLDESSQLIEDLLFAYYQRQVTLSSTPKATATDMFNAEFLVGDKVGHTPALLTRLVRWLVDQFGAPQGSLWDQYLRGTFKPKVFED